MVLDQIIEKLPETPDEPFVWVVYNEDHVGVTRDLINTIKGEGYCEKYCNVVSRHNLNKNDPKSIYYDPRLFDHIGNGSN